MRIRRWSSGEVKGFSRPMTVHRYIATSFAVLQRGAASAAAQPPSACAPETRLLNQVCCFLQLHYIWTSNVVKLHTS